MFSILSAEKAFTDPWVGNSRLNHIGLHTLRMRAAERCARLRSRQVVQSMDQSSNELLENGVVVLENFLPEEIFTPLKQEVELAAHQAEKSVPLETGTTMGFGSKIERGWGFDRFDGGTLNRFIEIDGRRMPQCGAFARDPRILGLSRVITGMPYRENQVWLYQTKNGDERVAPDLQKVLHRDTFFSSMKFWYYITPVEEKDGPFVYVPGSHKLTRERLSWEQEKALAACATIANPGAGSAHDRALAIGGSFRISEKALGLMKLPRPRLYPVAGNTLVIADTLGFHRRGDAVPGTVRLALYGNKRPMLPFSLLGH
ncbi:MAG: phytanoyl-CoA dioxygenase family protein [Gammaproteobacteria bacterium]|nr:phytanoyl-CoA dioxygenase family protein [Gammaproteobacteria bacterium]